MQQFLNVIAKLLVRDGTEPGTKPTTVRAGVRPCEENQFAQVDKGFKGDFKKCIFYSAQSTLSV